MENKKNWKVMLLNIDVVIASAAMVLLVALTFSGVIARYVVGRRSAGSRKCRPP